MLSLSFPDIKSSSMLASHNSTSSDHMGKLVWELDWSHVTKDPKELQYIYICCSKACDDDSESPDTEISIGMTRLRKFVSGGLIDAGYRRVFYMNKSMKEAGPNYGEIGRGGEAVNLSVCKVTLGDSMNERSIEVVECVVNTWKRVCLFDKEQKTWLNSNGQKALIEITVKKTEFNLGDRVTVELDLNFARTLLETGSSDQFRHKMKPLYGIANMWANSLTMPPGPIQHHLKYFKNDITDMNCRIIGLVMDVEGSYHNDPLVNGLTIKSQNQDIEKVAQQQQEVSSPKANN